MKLDLTKTYDINKYNTYTKLLLERRAKVEIKAIPKAKTVRQNAYCHVIIALYGIEYGSTLAEVKEEVFKITCNREIFVKEHVNKETGVITNYLKSFRDLDTKELTLAIERFRNYSSTHGLYLLSSDEYLDIKFEIDREIERHKQYL